MHSLKRVIRLNESLESVFNFFNRPENLEKLTPSFLSFHVLTPAPLVMHNGAVFDYAIRLLGLPMRWTSIIADYEPPHGFVDIQLRGPYAYWHHRHGFVQKEGCVDVIDEVHYEVGFSVLGKILQTLVIQHQLNRIFDYREKAIRKHFPTLAPGCT